MMKIACQKCHSQYRVDEKKIKGTQAKFRCSKCSNIVLVSVSPSFNAMENESLSTLSTSLSKNIPKESDEDDSLEDNTGAMLTGNIDRVNHGDENLNQSKFHGLSIGTKLLIMFFANVLIIGGVFATTYMNFVPSLLKEQINLRTYSVARSFSAAVKEPYLLKNYLRINQTAEIISKLPGVAYTSVVNKKGIAIAGIFGQKERFDTFYIKQIEKSGFSRELNNANRLEKGQKESTREVMVGGANIIDVAVVIDSTEGEVHVGMFTEDIQLALRKSLIPLGIILLIISILGSLGFLFMAKTVSKPMEALTQAAEKISVGDLETPIIAKGGREIEALAGSLERMRFSVNIAINRLRSR